MPNPSDAAQSTPRAPAKRPSRRGSIQLDASRLRQLRRSLMLSQRDLADEFGRRDIQVSIATIKRAEAGQAVRYRIAREIARYFNLPASELAHANALAGAH
jgi:transcriptional regulator with XRE-family HTH domain